MRDKHGETTTDQVDFDGAKRFGCISNLMRSFDLNLGVSGGPMIWPPVLRHRQRQREDLWADVRCYFQPQVGATSRARSAFRSTINTTIPSFIQLPQLREPARKYTTVVSPWAPFCWPY